MTENIFTPHTEPQPEPTLRRNLELPKGVLQKNAGRRIPTPASIRGRIERGIADLSGIGLHDLPETRAEVEEIANQPDNSADIYLRAPAHQYTSSLRLLGSH